jgi:hypothetical protein
VAAWLIFFRVSRGVPNPGGQSVAANEQQNQEPQEPSDLDLVPHDALVFASIQVANLWNSPAGQQFRHLAGALQIDFVSEIEKRFGVALPDVERVTAVGADPNNLISYLIVRAGKPYDEEKVLKVLVPRRESEAHGAYTIYQPKGGGGPSVCFFDERTLLVGPANVLVDVLVEAIPVPFRLQPPSPTGPTSNALRIMAGGEYHVVAGFSAPSNWLGQAREEMPAAWKPFESLLDLTAATMTLKVDNDLVLDAQLVYPDSARAGSATNAAKAAVASGREQLALFKKGAEKDPQQASAIQAAVSLEKMLEESRIEQAGTAVHLGFRAEGGNVPIVIAFVLPAITKALGGDRLP